MQKPTSLLDQLSQAARDEAHDEMTRLDERWDRLAAGTLSETENDELLGLADASGEAHEAYQAFKPLGPAFQKNVAAAILAQQLNEQREIEAASQERAVETSSAPPPVAESKGGFFRWAGAFAAGSATVAAALLILPTRGNLGMIDSEVRSPVLATLRSSAGVPAEDLPVVLEPGKEFSIQARPEDKIEGTVEAKIYVFQTGRDLVPLDFSWSKEQNGSFLLENQKFPELPELAEGPAEIVFVYFRPGHAPSSDLIREALGPGAPADPDRQWQLDRDAVTLKARSLDPVKEPLESPPGME